MEAKVRYLVDTNIWLERLLDQEKSDVVSSFLKNIPLEQLFISDFSLHSIGVILAKLKRNDVLAKFINDLFFNGFIEQISLDPHDFGEIISNIEKFGLDFDDAYQLTVSKKYDMTIVTFDKDFNVEGIKKIAPEDLLKDF